MKMESKQVGGFVVNSKKTAIPPSQGQVYIIDGRYMAAASYQDGKVFFVGKAGTWFDGFDKEEYQFEGPLGKGFTEPDQPKAVVIAGGTGIGAAISLLQHRGPDKETHLLFYRSHPGSLSEILKELGEAPCTTSREWENVQFKNPLDPVLTSLDDPSTYHYYLVGSPEMLDAVKRQCDFLGVPAGNVHTNY